MEGSGSVRDHGGFGECEGMEGSGSVKAQGLGNVRVWMVWGV